MSVYIGNKYSLPLYIVHSHVHTLNEKFIVNFTHGNVAQAVVIHGTCIQTYVDRQPSLGVHMCSVKAFRQICIAPMSSD